jgi:hypothetical protein
MNRENQIIEAALTQARRLLEEYGHPQTIGLSTYASDADLRQLRPEDGPDATAMQQRRMTDAVAAALRSEGHVVKLVTLRAAAYLQWLTINNRSNDAGSRAEWINLETTKS